MLGSFFSVLPLLVSLFWFMAFARKYRDADAAKRLLTIFFGVCTVLELCHALLYNVFEDRVLPVPLESLWFACSLSVYPIYYLYICRLTAQPLSPSRTTLLLAPGLLVAFASLLWPGVTIDSVRIALNIVQVACVVVFGSRLLRAFDHRLAESYAETEDKDMRPTRNLLILILLIAVNSIVLNILGRESVITSHWLILFALDPIAVQLFLLGYIGYRRSFRVEQFLADNPEETLPDAPAETQELGAKIEHLMVTEAYYLRQNITISDVAREVGSCRTYVSNYINQELHTSFSDYVNRLRIEHAKMVILQHDRHGSDSKFSVIAQDVGFTGEQSFYRNFRKFAGMTPMDWLEQQRGGLSGLISNTNYHK